MAAARSSKQQEALKRNRAKAPNQLQAATAAADSLLSPEDLKKERDRVKHRNKYKRGQLTKKIDEAEPAEDLLSLEGMEKGLAFKLASEGVVTREDLAELATDELLEINEMDAEEAAALIMKARAVWFEAENPESTEQTEQA